MTRYGMALDLKRCVGCGACVVACQLENNQKEGVAWVQLDTVEWGEDIGESGRAYVPHACMHCPDAPCAEVCPTGASVVMDDGVVVMDYDACINCGSCVQACPYGARVVNKTRTNYFKTDTQAPYEAYGEQRVNVVEKCDFCYDRTQQGLPTACVWNCPGKARFFGDLEDPESEGSQRIAQGDMVQIDETSFWFAPVSGMPDTGLPTAANLAQGESVAQNDPDDGVNPVAATVGVAAVAAVAAGIGVGVKKAKKEAVEVDDDE